MGLSKGLAEQAFVRRAAQAEGPDRISSLKDFRSFALNLASRNGLQDIVKHFLDNGADTEAVGEDGMTPLHWACKNGHQEIVTLLLDHGANIEAENIYCVRPLHFAIQNGHEDVVKLLLGRGANTGETGKDGKLPFYWARKDGWLEFVALLVDNCATTKEENVDSLRALQFDEFLYHRGAKADGTKRKWGKRRMDRIKLEKLKVVEDGEQLIQTEKEGIDTFLQQLLLISIFTLAAMGLIYNAILPSSTTTAIYTVEESKT